MQEEGLMQYIHLEASGMRCLYHAALKMFNCSSGLLEINYSGYCYDVILIALCQEKIFEVWCKSVVLLTVQDGSSESGD